MKELRFHQDSLERLCREPEQLDYELNPINRYYGTGSILRRYADLPPDEPLPFSVEHFIPFDLETPHDHDLLPGLPLFLASHPSRAAAYAKLGAPRALPAGFAIHYAMRLLKTKMNWQAPVHRCGTIAFPRKSTATTERDFDTESFARWLAQLPERFQPVCVNIYWRDFQRNKHFPYLDHGLPVYTCGHLFDPDFLLRFVDLSSRFQYACGNAIGSSIPLSILCGCHFMYKDTGDYIERHHGVGKRLAEDPLGITEYGVQLRRCAPDSPRAEHLECQRKLANELTGGRHILSRSEIRELYSWSRQRLLDSQPQQMQFTAPDAWARLNQWLPKGIEPDGWSRSDCRLVVRNRDHHAAVDVYFEAPPWLVESERELTIRVSDGRIHQSVCSPGYYVATIPIAAGSLETSISWELPGEKRLSETDSRLASFRFLGWRLSSQSNEDLSEETGILRQSIDTEWVNLYCEPIRSA